MLKLNKHEMNKMPWSAEASVDTRENSPKLQRKKNINNINYINYINNINKVCNENA